MEKLLLKVETRDEKTSPKNIRKNGHILGIVYGNKKQGVSISAAQNEFEKVLRKAGESTIVELQFADGSAKNVLIHDLQRDPVTHMPIHADFLEVDMNQTLTANVILDFVGESLAIKALGGTLMKQLDAVEVECLPKDLPHSIEVDISALKTFEDSILVSNIKAPAGVKILGDAEELVVKVSPPRDVEAELSKEVGDVSQVEGIKEEPKEEAGSAPSEQ